MTIPPTSAVPSLNLMGSTSSADQFVRNRVAEFLPPCSLPVHPQDSRNGPVVRCVEPYITRYPSDFLPVLRSPTRDANPFFHLVEAFYFLAGRDDLATLEYFNSGFGKYSDDGVTLWGSYGGRWRKWFANDQVQLALEELTKNPDSRRVVIQMWDGNQDLVKALGNGKDTPCNLCCVLNPMPDGSLNMEVYNRSNDLIYGLFGANMVHFNVFHSYICSLLGRRKGAYHQVSSNTHLYTEFEITKKLVSERPNPLLGFELSPELSAESYVAHTRDEVNSHLRMFDDVIPHSDPSKPSRLQETLTADAAVVRGLNFLFDSFVKDRSIPATELWFADEVLIPMMNAYRIYKEEGPLLAKNALLAEQHDLRVDENVHAENVWFKAGIEWMQRRVEKRKAKENAV